MKPIRYIVYTALCSLLLVATGCQKEELTKQSDSSTFTIQITGDGSASVLTRAEVVEKITTPLHLLIYKAGVADNVAPVLYKEDQLTDAVAKVVKCTLPPSMLVSDKYDIYVVGIADSEASGITDQTTKSQLLALTQTNIAEITSKTKTYMLAGVTLNTVLNVSPTVQIVRNVCRLDLTLTDESGNAFTAVEATLSAPDRTFLFSSALRGSGLDNTFPVSTVNKDQIFTLNNTTSGNFDGSVFFFEKMTTVAGVKTAADRVKLSFKATNTTTGETLRYATYINADADYITARNTIYEVHGTIKEGTIIIKTKKLPWGEVVQTEEKPIPVILQPKANCYLVRPGSEAILIPVAQANDAIASSIPSGTVLTAELVWTDVKGAKTGKGLESDAAVAAIEVLGSGPEATLMVTPGSQRGNAVIAVKSGTTIKWSWHIWVTDYDPEQEIGQNTSGGYIFMDRNLGAKTIVPDANGVDIAGNYYQYGRKDPFPAKGSALKVVPTYNAAGTVVTETRGNTTSAVNQIQNPYLWGNSAGYPVDLDLWDKNGSKTVNDPCPAGWRVPPSGAFADLNDALLPNDAKKEGRQGAHTGYYSYNYYREASYADIWNTRLITNWTSKPNGTTTAFMFRCETGSSVAPAFNYYRGSGTGMRCVRDWENKKFEKEVRVLSVGLYSVSKAHQLGTHDVNPGWSSGIVYLLDRNFGKGDPVDAFFKHYNYYKDGFNVDGKDYDIIDLLATHEIDVLYLPWNGDVVSPTADQSKKIVGWLDADPNRVLIVATEFNTQHDMLMAELGFAAHTYIQDGGSSVLAGGDNGFYSKITNGAYGKLAATEFRNILNNGWIPKSEIDRNGYVPILTRMTDVNKVTMSINPTRRVLLIGDTNWFDPGNALGAAGSLDYKGFGEYPLLLANTWTWIVETVKGK